MQSSIIRGEISGAMRSERSQVLVVAVGLFLTVMCLRLSAAGEDKPSAVEGKTRIAVIGLDHDHVWGLLHDIAEEPNAELVAIADPHPELISKAESQVPAGVHFYSAYVRMLDEAKPEAVIVTTANDRHLEIVRECAKRHIHVSTEKPMATNAADARAMEQLADKAGIKLMVNYWNAWTASSHALFHRVVLSNELGPVQKIIVQYGHQGPKEIGVSQQFAAWLYDPVKNGGGAIMDFGCYGAEWAIWLEGRPPRVYATAHALKSEQHNQVDDDATMVLEYPDATVIVEPSWDWPYGMDRVYVFGPKGSLLATRDNLFSRARASQSSATSPDGDAVPLGNRESTVCQDERPGDGSSGCGARVNQDSTSSAPALGCFEAKTS